MTRRLAALLALAAVALAASLALRSAGRVEPETWRHDTRGWWTLAPQDADPRSDHEAELARVLSLPYAAGTTRAGSGRFGVRAWNRERAQPGWNLYVSGHALEVVLMAMDGRVLHHWRSSLAELFPGRTPSADSAFFRRARLLPDGRLLALVQGTGVVCLDRGSRVLWRLETPFYNDLWVAPDGSRVLGLTKRAVNRPELRAGSPVLEDVLVAFDLDGHELTRASLLAAFARSPAAATMRPLGATSDIFHSNTIRVLDGPGAAASGPFARGNLLVSFREIDTLATLDPAAREVLWAQRGPFRGQHEVSLEADGRLLLFDNRGAPGELSRVLRVAPASGEIVWSWGGFPGHPLHSPQGGAVHRLDNGDLLVVESERGAAFELDDRGEVVWEFASPHRAGARHELVAALFDLVRIEQPTPFLASLGPAAGAPAAPAPQAP